MNARGKLTDRDTVIYEFDMLEYCYRKFDRSSMKLTRPEQNVYIECFLLHYRNLIDFFGKKPKRDDLSICRPDDWRQNREIDEREREKLWEDGQGLWDEYENRKRNQGNTVSRYLQHCTQQRAKRNDWNIDEMFKKLIPLINRFRSLCGDQSHVAKDSRRLVIGGESMHTATIRGS